MYRSMPLIDYIPTPILFPARAYHLYSVSCVAWLMADTNNRCGAQIGGWWNVSTSTLLLLEPRTRLGALSTRNSLMKNTRPLSRDTICHSRFQHALFRLHTCICLHSRKIARKPRQFHKRQLKKKNTHHQKD